MQSQQEDGPGDRRSITTRWWFWWVVGILGSGVVYMVMILVFAGPYQFATHLPSGTVRTSFHVNSLKLSRIDVIGEHHRPTGPVVVLTRDGRIIDKLPPEVPGSVWNDTRSPGTGWYLDGEKVRDLTLEEVVEFLRAHGHEGALRRD